MILSKVQFSRVARWFGPRVALLAITLGCCVPLRAATPSENWANLLEDNASVVVNIYGRVKVPGRYHLPKKAGLLGLVAAAGSFADFADTRHVKILRKDSSGTVQTIKVDFAAIRSGKAKDVSFEAEDTVMVAEKLFNL